MNCDCITRINEQLAEQNFALDCSFLLGETLSTMTLMLCIGTHWKDSSRKVRGKKPPTIVVTFCPFCGKKAAKEDGEAQAA